MHPPDTEAAAGGSLALCCMSNFVSSPCADERQVPESFSLHLGSQSAGTPLDEGEVLE